MPTATVGGIVYNLNSPSAGTATVGDNRSFSGAANIPATVTSGEIDYLVVKIGNYAFSNCTGLTSVTIPDSVTTIGIDAFASCSGLTAIIVDGSNLNYSSVEGVLFNKDKTVLIQFPGGKSGAYTIPNSVTSIGAGAFAYCLKLTSVTIPASVTRIGDGAFQNCSKLTSVTIPASVTDIGDYAFNSCLKLTSVTFLGNAPTNLGSYIFDNSPATIYYTAGKSGWGPTFAGHPTVAVAPAPVIHNYSIYFRK